MKITLPFVGIVFHITKSIPQKKLFRAGFSKLSKYSRCCLTLFLLFLLQTFAFTQDLLVGLATAGGQNGGGTSFSLFSNGTGFTVGTSFTIGGINPNGDLIKGSDGNYYGMTNGGGTNENGTVFKMTPAGLVTILKNLEYFTTGGYPTGSLIEGNDGNFYGMAQQGGRYNAGTIFKISPSGAFKVVKHLTGSTGSYPQGSLIKDTTGNFYGMAQQGGSYKLGTIFKVTPAGALTVLKNLDSTSGGKPFGSLVQGNKGNFYGMTAENGGYGYGTIFKMTPDGMLTVLKNLNASKTGSAPHGSLLKALDGNFYGMTGSGGSNSGGTIFKITPSGGFIVLKHLNDTTGYAPQGSLVQDADGNFYGMTEQGGINKAGTIFKLDADGSSYTVLKNLDGKNTGSSPMGSLMKDTDNTFWGMTAYGGNSSNAGVIFKITPTGTFTTLLRFPDGGRGFNPHESLLQASDGNFYGTTYQGGKNGYGTVYKLCPTGLFTTLRSFDYAATGGYPEGSLTEGIDGYFYGMTSSGGTYGYGTIFKISSSGTLTVLKHFDLATTGGQPYGGLVQGPDSAFYGMTNQGGTKGYGTIFKITPAGTFVVLKNLSRSTTGGYPFGSLAKGADGNFYGMTSNGGASDSGTIFRITPAGKFTVLKTLNASTGYAPQGNLIQYTDGNFYGMSTYGGENDAGTIFRISPSGTFTLLQSFNYAIDASATGANPQGSLVQGSDSSLYGLTSVGGKYSSGSIFKYIPATNTFTVLRQMNPAVDGGTPVGALVVQKPKPVATPRNVSLAEDSTKQIVLSGKGGKALTYTISQAPINGILTGTGANRTYIPKANYNGSDSFYFKVSCGCQTAAAAKVRLTIMPVNDTPVLAPIGNKTVLVGSTLTFSAKATDIDSGQTMGFSLIGAPTGATISARTGIFSWTPTVSGTYSFTVRVKDNGTPILYDQQKIKVTVTAPTLTLNKKAILEPERAEKISLTVSPNPSMQYFTLVLRSTDAEAGNLKVFDALGQVIETRWGIAANTLLQFGSTYKPGTYMAEVQQGTEKVYVKLVKQ